MSPLCQIAGEQGSRCQPVRVVVAEDENAGMPPVQVAFKQMTGLPHGAKEKGIRKLVKGSVEQLPSFFFRINAPRLQDPIQNRPAALTPSGVLGQFPRNRHQPVQ